MIFKQWNLKQWFAVTLLCVAPLTAEAPRGAVPRADAAAYASHDGQNGFQIGASLLTHKELKKIFATDVNQCCIVVEVAFYPAKDNFVKISLDDFMLREAGKDVGTMPSTAEVLAARLEVRPQSPDREHRPGVSGGSENRLRARRQPGNNGNKTEPLRPTAAGSISGKAWASASPSAENRRPRRRPRPPEGNRRAIEAELREKGLPEISAWEPVAGYLYFSVPKKSKGGYELVYMAGDKKTVLPLK